MAKNNRRIPEPPSPVLFWSPALVLWGVALFVIRRAFQEHDYVRSAYSAHNEALNGLSWGCFALAILLLIPSFRAGAVAQLDGLSSASRRRHALWIASAYVGIALWLGFIRYCEYRGFQLGPDTTVSVNEAYNFARRGALDMSVFGVNPLSIHFNFLRQMLSPALLLWNHPLAVILLEDAILFTAPIAVYCLAVSLTDSSLAGFCGFLLALSTPYLYELLTSNFLVSPAAVFLPWAMLFFGKKLWWPAGILLFVMAGCTEAMPLTFFGLGLYFIFAERGGGLRSWKTGVAVCGVSVAWWFADMAVIHHFSREEAVPFAASYWLMFKDMAPAGTAPGAIEAEVISHPFRAVLLLVSSRFKFYHVFRVLFYMGFLCLAAPAATLPFWTTVFPYVLAAPGTPMPFLAYQPHIGFCDFNLHEGAFMFAPLLWATALGIGKIYDRLKPRLHQGWLLAWVLLIAGFGFRYAQRTLSASWWPSWFDAMPRAMARIPPGARVWADQWASTPLSNRRWIKILGVGPVPLDDFENRLFKPDYVLIDKTFAVAAKPPYRDQMLTYLGANGYRKIVDDTGVILLESPDPSGTPEDVPAEWVRMPQPDPKIAEAYSRYLVEEDDGALSRALAGGRPRPDLAAAYDNLGLAFARQGRVDEAMRRYELALKAQPGCPEAENNLGAALAGQGKTDEAISRYAAALRSRPDYPEAQNNLGVALAAQGKLEEAIGHYESVLRSRPDNVEAHSNLGVALARQGRIDEAIRHYHLALDSRPEYAEAENNLGAALAGQGKLDEALEHIRHALRLNPDYPLARTNLEVVLKRLEKRSPSGR